MALGRNVIANIIGQAVRAATGILFVPIYVRYLGVESYGHDLSSSRAHRRAAGAS